MTSIPVPPVNILLVDDQPSKLLSYQAILADLGENLVAANSAQEALEHLLRSDFAVILVDVCMPEQDGFELVEMIRSHHRFQKTAIIFVSAVQLSDLDLLKGYATGAVDYVTVPIVPEILRAKVAVFVDLYRKTRELEQLNAELEQRVTERTARLTETQEALQEADRRKDMFLATLAHELRNPLAPMRSAMELLRLLDLRQPEARRAFEIMERQMDQMTRLIDDLMDLGRISRDMLELRKAPVSIHDVLQAAIESARPAIDAKKQRLTASLPAENRTVQVDAARITQVVANLLNNASRYTPEGGTIEVQSEFHGSELTIHVRDDGQGVDPLEATRIFEPFYQSPESQKRAHGGLGIGLTLVKTIVGLHGGTVSVASDGLGTGAEFTIVLPCRFPTKGKSQNGTPHCASATVRPRRILVVDDNLDAAEVLSRLLQLLGHEVRTANGGHEALKIAEEFEPEVVAMDLGMPGMDGFETASLMRQQPWGGRARLVALTGWGQADDRKRSAEAGFDRHLVKPVSLDALETLMAELDAEPSPTH